MNCTTRTKHGLALLAGVILATGLRGQWNNGGGGQQYLTAPTTGVSVGTSTTTPSALTVRGDEMSTPMGNVFRTYSHPDSMSTWKMFRGTTQVGRLFAPAGGNSFLIQQMVQNAALWLRNASDDGIRLLDNQSFTLNGYMGNPRQGYAALGYESAISGASPAMPWARLHLVGDGGVVSFGYRPWMQNGVLFNGNSDQMYIGHKYGTSDVSHAVISWSENGTLDGNRQTMRFIYTTTPAAGTGPAPASMTVSAPADL